MVCINNHFLNFLSKKILDRAILLPIFSYFIFYFFATFFFILNRRKKKIHLWHVDDQCQFVTPFPGSNYSQQSAGHGLFFPFFFWGGYITNITLDIFIYTQYNTFRAQKTKNKQIRRTFFLFFSELNTTYLEV